MKTTLKIIQMKTTKLLFVAVFSLLFNTNSKAQDVEKKYPIMTFEQKDFDLGTLNEGDVVERTYKFTNTGDAPLIISRIKASCGCTVPSGWKKTPIMPGEKSEFKVKFNTRHKIKKQYKNITITCNTKNGREIVRFHAFVTPDPKMEKVRAERRKKWAKQRKTNGHTKKVYSIFDKKYTEKELAVQQKIYAQRTKVKKLELKILKKESRLLLKKEKWSKEKVKVKKAEIQKYRKQIAEHNKKVYELRLKK